MVRSKEPDMKLSSTGDICSETTLNANKQKYIYIYENSNERSSLLFNRLLEITINSDRIQ